jgi:hypothetical protein
MPRLASVLDCVTDASLEIGIAQTAPTTAVGSLDQDIVQMVALLSAVADEVMLDEPYRVTLGDERWVMAADGSFKDRITADDDLIAFDGRLAVNGLKYRFLQAKGLEYAEQLRDFTTRLNKLAGRVNARVLDLDYDWGRVQ